jgi:hypothetical protein
MTLQHSNYTLQYTIQLHHSTIPHPYPYRIAILDPPQGVC